MARQIEMTWVCSACSHRNLGRYQRCQNCNDPKDPGEKYEMPSNTAAAPTVTDPELLRLAQAGANWRCTYCGSNQRKLDGSCQQCGAPSLTGLAELSDGSLAGGGGAPIPDLNPQWREFKTWIFIGAAVAAVIVTIVIVNLWRHRERNFSAVVQDAHWRQSIIVERYKIWSRDGWRDSTPSGAFDVVSRGQQIHHYDSVLDGYDTQYYTEQVACGQDCTDLPQSCHESCTSNNNGFATCTTSCSGGGRSCTTRYCSESRSRQVPRYRQEPRYAEGIRYQIWDWGFARKVDAEGTGTTGLRWPEDEARVGKDLGEGERERDQRESEYVVTLRYDGNKPLAFEVTLGELARFPIGSRHELRIKRDDVWVDKQPIYRGRRR